MLSRASGANYRTAACDASWSFRHASEQASELAGKHVVMQPWQQPLKTPA